MDLSPEGKTVVVAGDVTIDWNLIYIQGTQDSTALWSANNSARICPQAGGVSMLSMLIETACRGLAATLSYPKVTENEIHPIDPRYNHSYAIWSQQGEKDSKAWRVSQFLGIDPAREVDRSLAPEDDPQQASLVVLDDANLGFRSHPELWPRALKNSASRPWIILKLSYPIINGKLLADLAARFADRLVVVVNANDLRLDNAQISRGLSWERVAQDTLWELSYGPDLKTLSQCAHVVVSYKADGAALVTRSVDGLKCKLFFDHDNIENGWAAGYKGGMIGYSTCLAAAITRSILVDQAASANLQPAVEKGILVGLSAMRALHKCGYQSGGEKTQDPRIAFPYQAVTDDMVKPAYTFAQADIRDPLGVLAPVHPGSATLPRTGKFTILAQQCCDDLLAMARNIVRKGPDKTLSNVPLGRFGKLLTVDRTEIESYRTIGALIQEYINQGQADKPVSIAVFGAPGSGKSFGIKQIANSLSDRIKEITFNLSQMNSPDDLVGALHQVRDEALRGKIPLVFWDEFDTSLEGTPLGWLRYFLAPMQDGSFLEGQVTHPIGQAIFVFAGGTCDSMEEFGMRLDDDKDKNAKLFKAVKGPDFKSRLKGFINILGPNPLKGSYDPYFIIRRAILLHSLLRRNVPQIYSPGLQMDDNLLDAFLETQVYLHGVRSMESIVAMSQLSGKTRFERSCLPPISQLNLHVIGWEFMARVQKLKFEGDALDKLARAVHEDFVEFMQAQGYVYGPKIDEHAKPPTHNALVKYDQLDQADRIQNVQNALSIPDKLARSGYVMIHARTNEPPLVFPDKDLDLLAEAEHVRWVKARMAQDPRWHYAPATDKPSFTHNGLLPWSKASEEALAQVYSGEERAAMGREALPEAEKAKDRILIQRIPHILARVGYTVIKLGDSE